MLEWLEAHQLPCMFKAVFGIECPGCGFQRAVLLLLHGQLAASFLTWPGLFPLALWMLLVIGRGCGFKKISGELLKNSAFVCLIIILISYLLKLMFNTY